jgi:hypothetical protein
MKNRNVMEAKKRAGFISMAAALLLGLPRMAVAAPPVKAAPAPPDLTQGGKPDNEHRWTLGATGARGWVWSRYVAGGSENTDARQILITEVAKGSPADDVLQNGDVVTGLNGQAFGGNARILFAQALKEADTEANGGLLKWVRWRVGKTENVQLKLQVLGTYAPTAPYGCAKSKRIFEILWALPGVSRCGSAATAAYFKETSWYDDMARGWDGRVEHVGFRGENSYNGWDCTGSHLLGYTLPLKSLYLTGRKPGAAPVLTLAEVTETIAAGRDFTFQNADRKDWYAQRKTEVLLAGLSSWSPAVRLRSSQALSHREGDFLPQILELLNSKDRNSRYGACEALAKLGPKADSAAPQVRVLLTNNDPWLRMLAARTLAYMGPEVRAAAAPDLLRAALLKDPNDRRRRLVGEVAKALFAPIDAVSPRCPLAEGAWLQRAAHEVRSHSRGGGFPQAGGNSQPAVGRAA